MRRLRSHNVSEIGSHGVRSDRRQAARPRRLFGAAGIAVGIDAIGAMLLGGAKLDAPRALDWNFVASSRDAIASARDAWQRYPNQRFPQVPGETEFIPLPATSSAPSTSLTY